MTFIKSSFRLGLSAKDIILFSDKAKVISSPGEQFLIQGLPGLLDCNFRANPPLTYLRWEKDGYLYDPYNVPGVFLLHNGSLAFDHVRPAHIQRYILFYTKPSCTCHTKI